MSQMKSYIKPCITVVSIDIINMLCSSNEVNTMSIYVHNFADFGIYVKIEMQVNFVQIKNINDYENLLNT